MKPKVTPLMGRDRAFPIRPATNRPVVGLRYYSSTMNSFCKMLILNPFKLSLAGVALALGGCSTQALMGPLATPVSSSEGVDSLPTTQYDTQRIEISLPGEYVGEGGLIAADVDGDDQRDILVTRPGYIAAYSLEQGELWVKQTDVWLTEKAESEGLPGLHGPGIQAVDIDNDNRLEVLYLTENNVLAVLDGATGELETSLDLPPVDSIHGHWEHAIVADFDGQGDTDILLQASRPTNANEGYFRDSVQAAFKISDLMADEAAAEPIWRYGDFMSLSHGPAKVVDINGDGKDEVVGGTILSADGQLLHDIGIANDSFPHIDSLAVEDIDPDRPELEVVIPEEGGARRVMLYDEAGTLLGSDDNSGGGTDASLSRQGWR